MPSALKNATILASLAAVPNIEDAIPPTIETLEALRSADATRTDVTLSLATLLLSAGRLEESISLFKKVVGSKDSAVARCNYGIALLVSERFSEAVVELSKAVLMDSALVCAHLQLARAQVAVGDRKAAITALEKVIAYQPKNIESLCELATLYAEGDKSADRERAASLFLAALKQDPDCESAQIALGKGLVKQGVELFDAGKVDEACRIWGQAYRNYPRVFSGDSEVQQQMRSCIDGVTRKRLLPKSLSVLLETPEEDRQRETFLYVQLFLLSESLIPECFEDFETLSSQQDYWSSQTSTEQIFPYAHYRLGIVCGYLGDFEKAAHEILFARDYLPGSKHRSLRVDEVSAFFRECRELLASENQPVEDTSSPEAWSAHGFEDAFSQQAWRKSGCSPKEAAQWHELEVRAQDASDWKLQQISVEQARKWIAAEISSPTEVKRWLRAGIEPEIAKIWRDAFSQELSIAIQCVQLGFDDPGEAKSWLEVFLFPYEAIAWRQSGFLPDEAKKWMKSGIKDPFLAKQQRDEDEAIFAAARDEQQD